EEWFESFDFGWERRFSPRELKEGRRLYTGGAVRVLELRQKYASASLKFPDGAERYCVIDFDRGGFSLRGSSGDDFYDSVCAVAGFYEIEELMADELPPLKFVAPKKIEEAEIKPEEVREKKPEIPPQNRLHLIFKLRRETLSFSSYWKINGALVPSFGKNAANAASLTASERESLIRLASFARKAGFEYDGKSYVFSDVSAFEYVATKVVPQWRKYFFIPKNKDLDLLSKGVRDLNLSVSAQESGECNFAADFYASLDGEKIGFDELKILEGKGGKCGVLANRGLVRISTRDENLIAGARRAFDLFGGKPPRYMLFTLFDDAKIKISKELSSWKKSVCQSSCPLENLDFLRNYQRDGVSRILSLFSAGCAMLLADEMGLGKTVQSLAAISAHYGGSKKFLIVCPASVIPVWKGEIEKFFPDFKCFVFDSNTDFAANGGGIWLASYTQLRRNKQKLEGAEFEIAILDEAQYIKNPDSKISATCMSIKSKFRLALSGTPIENRLTDLWTIFRWLMPGLMGGRAQFERRMSEPDFSSTIKRQIAPFVLRRLKSEVARELPPKFVADLPCPMSDMQNAEYSRLMQAARETFKNSGGDARARVSILSLITRLRQAACDPALLPNLENCDFSNSGKISALCASLSSIISSGRKAVVFSQFVKFINRMKAKVSADFPEADIFELTGDVRDRALPVDSFQKTKKPAVIFVSLRAGGTGITLTGADYVFLADPWWNPAVEEQAIDRVHRI
ncbi:MAG: DEAD/DEAH box helicase, partial [Opitutales bacterium]|nr:DEAD/DEAH box helicase [Opitutales bacterium]